MSKSLIRLYRVLLVNYVGTFLLLIIANIPAVGDTLLSVQESVLPIRVLFALMGSATGLTFFVLFAQCLYHWGTHTPENFNKSGWLWVLLLLNFVGIVIYYIAVIEREYRASGRRSGNHPAPVVPLIS